MDAQEDGTRLGLDLPFLLEQLARVLVVLLLGGGSLGEELQHGP